MHPIEKFWTWFQKNNKAYLFLNEVDDEVKDRLLSELLYELHQFCPELYFEIGGHPTDDQELVITAEGRENYFELVENLVSKAPVIENWKIIAFKPAQGVDFTISYEGLELDPSVVWFLPLENKEEPNAIGIRVCLPHFEEISENGYLSAAVFKMLDTVIGERSFALDLDHIEIGELPEDPGNEGLISLSELGEYIQWRKNSLRRRSLSAD